MTDATEVWDVLDETGRVTGRTMLRSEPSRPGEYHLVLHVWIRNHAGEYLVQRRALHLDWWPGRWAATGGSAIAGESSAEGACREVREELGIALDPADLVFLGRLRNRTQFEDVWLVSVDSFDPASLQLAPEVMETRWVTPEELSVMVRNGDFFRYSYVHDLFRDPIPEQLTGPPLTVGPPASI